MPALNDLRPLLQTLVEGRELSTDLFDVCKNCAGIVVKKEHGEDSSDLATDFILNHLLARRITEIRTKTALVREMRRYLAGRKSGEAGELWQILSDAIRALANDGDVRRLDDDAGKYNSNLAEWVLPGCEKRGLMHDEFRKRADNIGTFYPRNEKGPVITPSDARKLVLGLLQAAKAPVMFGTLFEEAKRHVVLHVLNLVPEAALNADGETKPGLEPFVSFDEWLWFDEEGKLRAERLWKASRGEDPKRKVLCLYFIPKNLLGLRVRQGEIGDSKRVSEQVSKLIVLLRKELGVPQREHLALLVDRVFHYLKKKCSEFFHDPDFYEHEPGHTGEPD